MSTMNSDLEALERMARFPEGVSADPTKNMSPEDAAKWKAMNEEHRDKFKSAFDELAALDLDLTAGSIPEVALERDLAALEEHGRLAAIERSANQMVAKTILDQMGGQRRLMAMIGATNFIAHSNPPGVSFKFMQTDQPSKTGNYIKILLNEGLDLYEVEFGYIRGMNYRKVKEFPGVDAEMLGRLFRQQTGLALRLAATTQEARFEKLACDCEDGDEMLARFEEGVSADPTEHMSPEDAAKWKAENAKHRDKFKEATFEEGSRIPDGWDPGETRPSDGSGTSSRSP